MDELKKINSKVAMKQAGRLISGIGSVVIGTLLIGRYMYGKGIRAGQKSVFMICPKAYEMATKELAESIEHLNK